MTRRTVIAFTAVVVFSAAAGLLRMNDLSLFTDSTRYVIWATSLSNANGWIDETTPDPNRFVVNAPFYPLLIAPSQWIEQNSLAAAKSMTLLYGLAAIALFFLWSRRTVGDTTALIISAAFAVMPLTIVLFTEALSEAPFLVLVFAILVLTERSLTRELTGRERVALIAFSAVIPLVREIGIVFVAAIVVELVRRRQKRTAALIAGATVIAAAVWTYRNLVLIGAPPMSQSANVRFILQHVATPEGAPLAREFVERFWLNIRSYSDELGGMVLFPFPLNLVRGSSGPFIAFVNIFQSAKSYLPILFLPAVAFGTYRDLRAGGTAFVRTVFLVLYVGVVLLYPVQDIRFFLPIIPFLLIVLARGAQGIIDVRPGIGLDLAVGAAACVIGANAFASAELIRTNLTYLRTADDPAAPAMTGFYATPWSVVGSWITDSTAHDAVIASPAKEIAPFTHGRLVLEINRAVPLPAFESLLRDHDVSYLLVPELRPGVRSYEFHLTESRRLRFEKVFEKSGLELYRVRSAVSGISAPASHELDTGSAGGTLLRAARKLLLKGEYEHADSLLLAARRLDPGNPETAFQRVVASALSGDLSGAITRQQDLFSAPRSTSYLPVGRALLSMVEKVDRASKAVSGQERAQELYEAGRTARDLGYDKTARELFLRSLKANPEHFEALLWAAHAEYVLGDLAAFRMRCTDLEHIDRTNEVVVAFRRLDSLVSASRASRVRTTKADCFLQIADAFASIGLHEDALDAGELAGTLSTTASIGYRKMSEILSAQRKTFGAARYASKH